MRVLAGLLCGLVFGVGLVVSGMADPAKVLNFLELAGSWDPSLLFVMAAAVAVTFFGYRLARRRGQPLFGAQLDFSTRRAIDPRLAGGAAIFGLGWGLSGFCPGPAFTAVTSGAAGSLAFIPAMLVGMWLARMMPRQPVTQPAS
jgi:uncharacterized membrane protein YedE/YeeE